MRVAANLKRVSALAGLMALLSTGGARADGPAAPGDLVKADLVSESDSTVPGATAWVDLHLEIKPGWHVYWQNPGDSGLPTTIDWKLPPGFSVGHILWPVPEHFVQNGIGNYGYAGAVDLLLPIAGSKELIIGQTAMLDAEVSWLACADICIPGEAKLGLNLAVAYRDLDIHSDPFVRSAAVEQVLEGAAPSSGRNGAGALNVANRAKRVLLT